MPRGVRKPTRGAQGWPRSSEALGLRELDDVGVGFAVEKGGAVAFGLDAGAVEPGVAAERGDHLVDERTAALLRSAGDGGRRGAGEVRRLGAGELRREESGGEDDEGEALHAGFIFRVRQRSTGSVVGRWRRAGWVRRRCDLSAWIAVIGMYPLPPKYA